MLVCEIAVWLGIARSEAICQPPAQTSVRYDDSNDLVTARVLVIMFVVIMTVTVHDMIRFVWIPFGAMWQRTVWSWNANLAFRRLHPARRIESPKLPALRASGQSRRDYRVSEGGMIRSEILIELKFLNSSFFELILVLKLDKQFPVEQFEATVSQSTVPSPPLRVELSHVAGFRGADPGSKTRPFWSEGSTYGRFPTSSLRKFQSRVWTKS